MKYYEEVNQSLADKTVHYYNLYKKVRSWLLAEIHYSLSHWRTVRREGSGCSQQGLLFYGPHDHCDHAKLGN